MELGNFDEVNPLRIYYASYSQTAVNYTTDSGRSQNVPSKINAWNLSCFGEDRGSRVRVRVSFGHKFGKRGWGLVTKDGGQ